MRKNKIEKLLSNPSVIVVLVPAVSIMMAYMFKLGYCLYFEIPFPFVVVSAKDVSVMAASLMAVVFILISFDYFFSMFVLEHFFKKYEKGSDFWNDQYELYCCFIFFSIFVAILSILGVHWVFILLVSIFLLVIPIQFLYRHIRYSRGKKVRMGKKKETQFYCQSIFEKAFGSSSILVIFLIFAIATLSLFLGIRFASLQKDFFKIDNRDDIVGIEIVDNLVISKKLTGESLKTNSLIDLSSIQSLSKDSNVEFQMVVKKYNLERFGLSDFYDI